MNITNAEGVQVLPLPQVIGALPICRPALPLDARAHELVPGAEILAPDGVVKGCNQVEVWRRRGDDRIALILLPGQQAIAAGGRGTRARLCDSH